jgi:hypothetical protein
MLNEPFPPIIVLESMRLLLLFLCFTSISFAQIESFSPEFKHELQVHYYPFYNGVQLIELDYFAISLERGRWGDMVHPRGGSDYHDAISFDRPNGFILRNDQGEIIKTIGVVETVELESPDKAITITHKERLKTQKYQGGVTWKDANGYGYRFSECSNSNDGWQSFVASGGQCFGIIDTLGNIVIEGISSSSHANGEYLVMREGKYAIYDSTFAKTLDFVEGRISRSGAGKYLYVQDNQTKIINRYGEQIDKDNYVKISKTRYGDEYIYASKTITGLRYGVMRSDLTHLTPPIYKSVYPLRKGFSVSNSSDKWALLNDQGVRITDFEFSNYNSFRYYDDGTYSVYKRDKSFKQGMIDTLGNVIIPIMYDRVERFKNDLAVVTLNGKVGIINRKGEVQGEIAYTKIINVYSKHVHVNLNGNHGIISRTGEVILEPDYRSVSCFDSDFLYVSNHDNERFFYNVKTKELIPCPYYHVWCFTEGFCKVNKDGKMGMVDTNMEIVIPLEYDYVSPMQGGTVVVKKGEFYGLYNSNFELIKPIKFKQFRANDSGGFEVY